MPNKTGHNLRITPIKCSTSWLGRDRCLPHGPRQQLHLKKNPKHRFKTFLLRSPQNTSGGRTKLHERVGTTARMQHAPTLPYLAMSCSIVKEESFYEEQSVRHLFSMLRGPQSSDVTSPRPRLASAAAADRSDEHSEARTSKAALQATCLAPNRSALPYGPSSWPV